MVGIGCMYLPPYFFLPQHITFSKDIVLCAMSATQYFLKKIMCCGKFVTTHYFFKKYCVVACLSQHITFWVTTHYFFKRYCVVRHVRNAIFFLKKIMCCGRKKQGGRYMPPYIQMSGTCLSRWRTPPVSLLVDFRPYRSTMYCRCGLLLQTE